MAEQFSHYSVMLHEAIEALNIKPDGIYVDCTAGGGGHSLEIAKHLSEGGRLICIDQDTDAIAAATKRLEAYLDRTTFVHNNFSDIDALLNELGIEKIDGALLDLGVSSYQLDTPERGFSYNNDAPLDMRMDREAKRTAYDIVNGYSRDELRDIIAKWGEERFAGRIASRIVEERESAPIENTGRLAEIICSAIPAAARENGPHPAKRTFQAIRIEVNREIDIIEPTLRSIVNRLAPEGRLAVITFHSLEDRAAKQTFKELEKGCICPPELPVCVCNHKSAVKIIYKKPILPSQRELEENPRSRSAKLRAVEKL